MKMAPPSSLRRLQTLGEMMKYLIWMSFIFTGTAYAGNYDKCSDMDTQEVVRLAELAENYFWKSIEPTFAADNFTLVENSFKGAVDEECYDYESQFDYMEFDLIWKQKAAAGNTQECSQVVHVDYLDEVRTVGDAACKDVK